MNLRWRREQSPYVLRSDPPGWTVSIALSSPAVPLPGPPRPGHGQSCPWLRVPGPPRAQFDAWRVALPGATDADGRRPLPVALGCYPRPEQARAACAEDAAQVNRLAG